MKSICNWGDLEQYGIDCLTGEACSLSCRALCDLSKEGADIVREFFGLPCNAQFNENWNLKGEASCFLPWSVLHDLAAFILIKKGAPAAYLIQSDGVYAPEPTDTEEDVNLWVEFHSKEGNLSRRYAPLNHPRRGLSCTHALTGRSA